MLSSAAGTRVERLDERPAAEQRGGRASGGSARSLLGALSGLRGAGQSAVAGTLEVRLGLRRVCRDAIRQAMFPRCDFRFVDKRAAFRTVLLAVEINCLLGESRVIDGMTFSRRGDFDEVAALADRHGFDVLPLLIDCPPALARERIARDLADGRHPAEDREPELVDIV